MIKSFDIENFRCFEQASLKDLRKINIIVGDNASGKTALGEAIVMSASVHPELTIRIRATRNMPLPEKPTWNRQFFEKFWQDFFYNFDISKKIKFTFIDSLNGEYKSDIYYDKPQSLSLTTLSDSFSQVSPLIFKRTDNLGNENIIKVTIDGKGGLSVDGSMEAIPNFYAFASTQQYYISDIVKFYSDLSKEGEIDNILKSFQTEFPQVSGISIQVDEMISSLYATLKNVKKPRPLTIISAGAVRYLNFLLSISSIKNGIIMIDEIENGIYWKKMSNIWETLRKFCHNNQNQLFASTHSNDCLQALLPSMEKNEDDFSLIRTEIDKEGKYKLKQFYGKSFKAALGKQGEVR